MPKRKVNESIKKYAKRLSSVLKQAWQNRPTSVDSPSRQDGQRLGIIESGDTWWRNRKLKPKLTRDYIREIESITGIKVHPEQIRLLKDALRKKEYIKLIPAETRKHRSKLSRTAKDKLIKKWEKKTGQTWPRYEENVYAKTGRISRRKGRPYDVHHIIENGYEGPHEWWNIHPARFPDQHQRGIHSQDSASRGLFPRRKKR